MHKWYYEGPVVMFNLVVNPKWISQTTAPTEEKARNNLAYQFKKQYDKAPSAKVTLTGKLRQIG